MNLLLDTHVLLWASSHPELLSQNAIRLLEDPNNTLYFSAANLWEIAIKQGLGRADFVIDAARFRSGLLDNGYQEIHINSEHALRTLQLPAHHKDPFDRMLIAQAICEGLTLLTADKIMANYQGPIRMV